MHYETGQFVDGLLIWKGVAESVWMSVSDYRFLGFVAGLVIMVLAVLVVSATIVVIAEKMGDRRRRIRDENRNNTSKIWK